jgi:hypothetical protein
VIVAVTLTLTVIVTDLVAMIVVVIVWSTIIFQGGRKGQGKGFVSYF